MLNLKSKATHYCANWNNGNCLGAFFVRKNGLLCTKMRKKYANKPCQVEEDCSYFNNVVVPGINE
tara:strand:+ start:59 stop:253 length:195 start_codon:yes stop_codon:yes gene_type:complete